MRSGPKMEMIGYQDKVYKDVEEVKATLKGQWLNAIHDVYKVCQKKRQLPWQKSWRR